ncbi:hypothetical protein [Rubripirellula amarantea]|nr:hypothetical protein [Rubripirellula amarantea]
MYSLTCPHCQHAIPVAPSKAGQEMLCPECQRAVQVPKLGQLKSLPRVDSVEDGGGRRELGARGLSDSSSIVFVICALIATACLLVAGLCGIRWYLIESQTTTEEHVALLAEQYSKANAAQLIREYEQMEELDIDIGGPYGYKVTQREKDDWGFNALMAAIVGSLAFVGALVSVAKSRDKSTENLTS